MPARERTVTPPGEDATSTWMREVTANLESLSGRIIVIEKSVDMMSIEVRRSTDVAASAASAMERIAKAEELRAAYDKDRNKLMQDQAKIKEKWFDRLWSTPALQLLLTGIVVSILQLLGVSYIISQFPGGSDGSSLP